MLEILISFSVYIYTYTNTYVWYTHIHTHTKLICVYVGEQCQEIEEHNRMGKLSNLIKIRYQGDISCKDGHDKGQKW